MENLPGDDIIMSNADIIINMFDSLNQTYLLYEIERQDKKLYKKIREDFGINRWCMEIAKLKYM